MSTILEHCSYMYRLTVVTALKTVAAVCYLWCPGVFLCEFMSSVPYKMNIHFPDCGLYLIQFIIFQFVNLNLIFYSL